MNIAHRGILAGTLALAACAWGPLPASAAQALQGANVYGRTGLLFTDTAQVAGDGKGLAGAHLLMFSDDDFDGFSALFGAGYGIQQVELYGSGELASRDPDQGDSASGLGSINVGGRWQLPVTGRDLPDFAVGLDISHGPLDDDLGPDGTDITLKGMATHVIAPQGLLINGGLGILFVDEREVQVVTPVGTFTAESDSDTVIQLNAGAAYPFTPSLTGIVELAINQFGEDAGALSLGVRGKTRGGIGFQGLLSFGLDEAPDLALGAGLFVGFGGL